MILAGEGERRASSRSQIKKFNSKILTSKVRNILKLLDAGNYPAKIARILGLSRPLVHYYIRKLVKRGYLTKIEGKPTFYELTVNGKKFLDKIESSLFSRVVRLHNVVVKYPVIMKPKIVIDWRRVELQNWGQLIGSELGCTVRKNPRSVEVFPDVVEGDNPYELLLRAVDQANRVASSLEEKFQMRLGRPSLSRKPHFAVYDPVVGKLAKFMQFSDDVGKLDESEGYGEIDFYDPNFAKNYLLTFTTLPRRVDAIGKQVASLEASLTKFSGDMKRISESFNTNLKAVAESFSKDMQAHLGILEKLGDAVEQLSLESQARSEAFKTESEGRSKQHQEVLERILRVEKVLVAVGKGLAKRKRRRRRRKPKPKSRLEKLRKRLKI